MQTKRPSLVLHVEPSESAESGTPIHRCRSIVAVLFGLVGFFVLVGLMLYLSATDHMLSLFVNVPALIWMVVAPVTLLLPIFGWAGLIDAISYVAREPSPSRNADDAVTVFRLWAAFSLASGFIATMVGLVVMLGAIEDPATLGPGMAVALLSQLYGVLMAVICVAIAAIIARRHNGPSTALPVSRQAAGVAGITVVAGTMTVLVAFGILMLAFPQPG